MTGSSRFTEVGVHDWPKCTGQSRGTSSADQMSEWILDANDSELAGLAVDFIPFRTSPIAIESKYFSSFKARFSPGH